MNERSAARRTHPLTERECLILDRIGRDRTHKEFAAELGVSINMVANLAAPCGSAERTAAPCASAATLNAMVRFGTRPERVPRIPVWFASWRCGSFSATSRVITGRPDSVAVRARRPWRFWS